MRLATLIRLYPERWRRRYGEEFGALLEHQRQSPSLLADIVRGAILAHVRPYPPGGPEMNPRSRVEALGSLIAIFAILPAVVVATSAAVGALQPSAYEPSRTAHEVIGWMGAQPGVVVAGLFVVAPALALVVGSAGLWLRIRADTALRADLTVLGAVLARLIRRPTLIAAAVAVLAAAGVLAFVVDHLIVG